jgi:hypothetical protein
MISDGFPDAGGDGLGRYGGIKELFSITEDFFISAGTPGNGEKFVGAGL